MCTSPCSLKAGRSLVVFHLSMTFICKLQVPFRENDFLKTKQEILAVANIRVYYRFHTEVFVFLLNSFGYKVMKENELPSLCKLKKHAKKEES